MRRVLGVLLTTTFLLAPLLSNAETLENVEYSIIHKLTMGRMKCIMDIRLSKKVSKAFLSRLALKLRDQEPIQYESMFICYYLPGMSVRSGAWASTHFMPDLEVKILGLTQQEEQALINSSEYPKTDIIGQWFSQTLPNKTTLVREENAIFMIQEFKDGSKIRKEMIQKNQDGYKRFEAKTGSSVGEYYLIDGTGKLSNYDQYGLIDTLLPVKSSPSSHK